ncbi:hypothetical protein D3C72_615220 [compost metagenome]
MLPGQPDGLLQVFGVVLRNDLSPWPHPGRPGNLALQVDERQWRAQVVAVVQVDLLLAPGWRLIQHGPEGFGLQLRLLHPLLRSCA